MNPETQWLMIPDHLRPGLARYLLNGVLPGGFLSSMISNDLMGAVTVADQKYRESFFEIARFFILYMPRNCFGSPEAIHEWRKLPPGERRRRLEIEIEGCIHVLEDSLYLDLRVSA
jgi:hypothetical protein